MSRTAQARARSIEQLKEHYEIEAELADRLRHSTRESRALLYSAVYDELFRRVPAHPALTRVTQPEVLAEVVEEKLRLLSRFLRRDSVFLEVGAGDCRLSLAVADKVRQVYALDVSAEVVRGVRFKRNASFILSKGTDIPLPENSVDVAYSYQVMEHIHPDDALEQLGNIHRVLAPGGLYVCVTPNRLTGPHDISRYFSPVARGFHLKEYTVTELETIFRGAGFAGIRAFMGVHGRFTPAPASIIRRLEAALDPLPPRLRKRIALTPGVRHLLMPAIVATKRRRLT